MNSMTKQDLFAATEIAKNKILEKLVTRYDVQMACEGVKDQIIQALQEQQLENQATFRQMNAASDQIWRKLSSLSEQVEALNDKIDQLTQEEVEFSGVA